MLNNIRKIAANAQITKSITLLPEPLSDSRSFKFVISTADVDTSYDVVHQDGWRLDYYLLNPCVLWSHCSENLPIGRCTSIAVEDGKLKATVEFATADCNPLAEQVYNSVKNGFVQAASVGFMPVDWEESTDPERGGGTYSAGFDYKSNLLREFSLCSVPANQFALLEPDQRAVKSAVAINTLQAVRSRRKAQLELRGRIR